MSAHIPIPHTVPVLIHVPDSKFVSVPALSRGSIPVPIPVPVPTPIPVPVPVRVPVPHFDPVPVPVE